MIATLSQIFYRYASQELERLWSKGVTIPHSLLTLLQISNEIAWTFRIWFQKHFIGNTTCKSNQNLRNTWSGMSIYLENRQSYWENLNRYINKMVKDQRKSVWLIKLPWGAARLLATDKMMIKAFMIWNRKR